LLTSLDRIDSKSTAFLMLQMFLGWINNENTSFIKSTNK
jgi:hypothetical protein